MQKQARSGQGELPKRKLILGIIIVLIGQTFPLYIPLVAKSGLPSEWKTALSGLFAFGIPNIFMFMVVVMLGNSGFAAIKKHIFKWLKKQVAPPDIVGRVRYLIGLILFCVPVVFGWLLPYVMDSITLFSRHRVLVAMVGDVMLVIGLFVLGGNFWDKLRSLFVRNAKVVFPA